MPRVLLGTAQLYGLADSAGSQAVLEEAWRCGVRCFDTAPSYGSGRGELELGTFLAGRGDVLVSTKVGLAPRLGPVAGRAAAVAAITKLLPRSLTERLRSAAQGSVQGRFGAAQVRASVDTSLHRLGGRVDRLLLHEVLPGDITDELLQLLERYRAAGDVGEVGVATQNHHTLPALARGRELLTVAHTAVGPLHETVALPAHVTTRVGHGLLGEGGTHLRALDAVLVAHPDAADRWRQATTGTPWASVATSLLGRAPALGMTDVIVATTRPGNVAAAVELAGGEAGPPPHVAAALEELIVLARAQALVGGP